MTRCCVQIAREEKEASEGATVEVTTNLVPQISLMRSSRGFEFETAEVDRKCERRKRASSHRFNH